MKIIAIGDLHGRSIWKNITVRNDYDKIVFIGDYFDANESVSAQGQQENFSELVAFKKQNPERVILLLGNHEYHYLRFVHEHYSYFQPQHEIPIQELLHSALDENLLQVCFVHGNIIFSHAGLTKTWCAANSIDIKNPGQQVNDLFRRVPAAFRFTPGNNYDPSGDDITQSPIWVRPNSLAQDKIDGYTQVAGHTPMKKIIIDDGIILIDALASSGEYLLVDGGKFYIEKVL